MKILIKSFSLTLVFGFLMAMVLPAFGQSNLFSDPLENIKEKMDQERIEVIDFSVQKWGNLPNEITEKLKESFDSLEDLKTQFETDKLTPEEQVKELEETYELTNRQAYEVHSAMAHAGETQVNAVILTVMNALKNLIGAIAILLIVIAGLRMVLAQGEDTAITEQKRNILYAVIGLGIILLIEQIVRVIYGAPGLPRTITELDLEFSDEILGIVAYLKSLLAILALIMIILSGIRTIFAFGEEEKIKNQRKSILWIIVGMVLIIINKVIVEQIFIIPVSENTTKPTIGFENVNTVIALFATVAKFALGFMGLIALALLIYGGALMIVNYSSDEQVEKAKKIMKNAGIGILISISSFALMATLIDFTP